jgi:hypothetical protein
MMMQPAPSPKSSRGYDVRLCLIGCSKLRRDIREACYQRCFQEYLSGVFTDITQVATENGVSPHVLIEALKAEFDIQFEARRNEIGSAVGAAAVGT